MDAEVVKAINAMAGQWPVLDETMKALSTVGLYLCILALLLLFFKSWRAALSGVVGILFGLVINYLIVLAFTRPRPFAALDSVEPLLEKSASASFPSDTVMAVFAAAAALWFVSRKLGRLAAGLAVLIAFSRVYIGHHYMTDVLAGALIGVITTAICFVLFNGQFNRENHFSYLKANSKKTHFPQIGLEWTYIFKVGYNERYK